MVGSGFVAGVTAAGAAAGAKYPESENTPDGEVPNDPGAEMAEDMPDGEPHTVNVQVGDRVNVRGYIPAIVEVLDQVGHFAGMIKVRYDDGSFYLVCR